MSKSRPPAEDYLPTWADDAPPIDYCYAECRCGWRSENKSHPDGAKYEQEIHIEHVTNNPDCSLPKIVAVHEDGSTTEL